MGNAPGRWFDSSAAQHFCLTIVRVLSFGLGIRRHPNFLRLPRPRWFAGRSRTIEFVYEHFDEGEAGPQPHPSLVEVSGGAALGYPYREVEGAGEDGQEGAWLPLGPPVGVGTPIQSRLPLRPGASLHEAPSRPRVREDSRRAFDTPRLM